jgi:hypothetical protein
MTTANRLGPIELEESGSRRFIPVGSSWEDRPAVLVFLRHFG